MGKGHKKEGEKEKGKREQVREAEEGDSKGEREGARKKKITRLGTVLYCTVQYSTVPTVQYSRS